MVRVAANAFAFAALTAAGRVVAWGEETLGGDTHFPLAARARRLRQGVRAIQASSAAFAALKEDGVALSWGDPSCGGDSSVVQEQLVDVVAIAASSAAFAALKRDGTVVSWGMRLRGGDSSGVQGRLHGVVAVAAAHAAFAALTAQGEVVTWGGSGGQSEAVQQQLVDVRQLAANLDGFAALRGDGSVVAWGDGPAPEATDVTALHGCGFGYGAVTRQGAVLSWRLPVEKRLQRLGPGQAPAPWWHGCVPAGRRCCKSCWRPTRCRCWCRGTWRSSPGP